MPKHNRVQRVAWAAKREAEQASPASVTKPMRVTLYAGITAAGQWANQPAAETLLFGNSRSITMVDLFNFTKARILVNKSSTAANTGATLDLKYKTGAFSSTVADYAAIGTSSVQVDIDTASTHLSSAWIPLASSAMANNIFIAVTGTGGDGVIDPDFGLIAVEFK